MADDGRTAARLVLFSAVGVVTTAQEVATTVLTDVPDADAVLVAEETLALVATATARAIEAGAHGEVRRLSAESLIELPFVYRDYFLGARVLEGDGSVPGDSRDIYGRLERKKAFYEAHLPPGVLPTGRLLAEKMALWMGRVSPPRLPEMPQKRLARLAIVPRVESHVRVVYEFARSTAAESGETG